MLKIDHIGIAVKNMEVSKNLFTKLLGYEEYKEESVELERVNTVFYQLGESKIELLEGIGEGNVISKFIQKRGEGIHHIAIEVEDIYQEILRLKKEGFDFLADEPKHGADNKLICFLHPKSCNGVLIELCQEKKIN